MGVFRAYSPADTASRMLRECGDRRLQAWRVYWLVGRGVGLDQITLIGVTRMTLEVRTSIWRSVNSVPDIASSIMGSSSWNSQLLM